MARLTQILHANGMVTYCLPPNPKLMKDYWDNRRKQEIEKIECFIEGLDNVDAGIALKTLLKKHRRSKKIRQIVETYCR